MADKEAPFPTQSLSPGNGGTTDITEETLHSKKKKKAFLLEAKTAKSDRNGAKTKLN